MNLLTRLAKPGLQALWAAALVALALLAPLAPLAAHAQTAAPSATAGTQPAASSDYRLGAGDVVRITVYQNPDLTLETRITESGVVSYPLLGPVRLGGRNVTAAEQLLAEGLKAGNFVKQPQVTLTLLQVRAHQANVLGQVNRPGRYALEQADMRLTDLLALAGGTSTVGAEVAVLTGTRNGQAMRMEIDLPALFAPGGRQGDPAIQNGDVIWVDRQPLVYIYGEVQRPGALRLERGMTLMQGLATGGGLTQRGTEKGIRVHRRGADGKVQVLQPQMDDKLSDGDVIYVRESLF